MCTLLTLDQKTFWNLGENIVRHRIMQDSLYNDDGASLVFLDPIVPENNIIVRSMNIYTIIELISRLMADASEDARFFLHLRAATTHNVGVAYTHAFDDMNGTIYMHNGVITNKDNLSVDSFNLANLVPQGARELWEELITAGETFANVFQIDTDSYIYNVVRMRTGTLYSDGKGNYSTNPIKKFGKSVKKNSYKAHLIGLGAVERTTNEILNFQAERIPNSVLDRPAYTPTDIRNMFLPGSLASMAESDRIAMALDAKANADLPMELVADGEYTDNLDEDLPYTELDFMSTEAWEQELAAEDVWLHNHRRKVNSDY